MDAVADAGALRDAFRRLYGTEPRLFRAPGRVNLIGEHTDYNDGFVLPVAIDRGTTVAAAPRPGRRVRVRSLDLGRDAEFDLDAPGPRRRGSWLDYVEGVAAALSARGIALVGADLAISSDVPIGAGLSSSAALEMAVGKALAATAGAAVDDMTLALAGQAAEHAYVGIRSGIMDQLAAIRGRAGHALLVDCRSLQAELVPLAIAGAAVVVCDSGVKHALASSEYNARRAECERGVELLREVLPGIRALRDVALEDLVRVEDRLPEPVRRRCRHVVTENARTLEAARALAAGDGETMRGLMAASHASLRDDYEVSSSELDALVEGAAAQPGVLGARMTGGGFGGCTVNLVLRDAVDRFRGAVARYYTRATGRSASIFVAEPSDGAAEIVLGP
jgi:galactokinase